MSYIHYNERCMIIPGASRGVDPRKPSAFMYPSVPSFTPEELVRRCVRGSVIHRGRDSEVVIPAEDNTGNR